MAKGILIDLIYRRSHPVERGKAYISSAGLRVLLTIQKNQTGKISVINISDDVLDIFRMAGFQHFMDLKGV